MSVKSIKSTLSVAIVTVFPSIWNWWSRRNIRAKRFANIPTLWLVCWKILKERENIFREKNVSSQKETNWHFLAARNVDEQFSRRRTFVLKSPIHMHMHSRENMMWTEWINNTANDSQLQHQARAPCRRIYCTAAEGEEFELARQVPKISIETSSIYKETKFICSLLYSWRRILCFKLGDCGSYSTCRFRRGKNLFHNIRQRREIGMRRDVSPSQGLLQSDFRSPWEGETSLHYPYFPSLSDVLALPG